MECVSWHTTVPINLSHLQQLHIHAGVQTCHLPQLFLYRSSADTYLMTTCLEISVTADGTIITAFSPLVQEHFKFSCTTMNWNSVMQLDPEARSTRLVSIVQHATPPISCYYLGALATGRVTLPTSCENFCLEFIRPVHVSNTPSLDVCVALHGGRQ